MNTLYGNNEKPEYIFINNAKYHVIRRDIFFKEKDLNLSHHVIYGNIKVHNGNVNLTNCYIRPTLQSNEDATLECYKQHVSLINVDIKGSIFLSGCNVNYTSGEGYGHQANKGTRNSIVHNIEARQSRIRLKGVCVQNIKGIASQVKIIGDSRIERDVELSDSENVLIVDSQILGTLLTRGNKLNLGDNARIHHVKLWKKPVDDNPQLSFPMGSPERDFDTVFSYSSMVINGGRNNANTIGGHSGRSTVASIQPIKPQAITLQKNAELQKLTFDSSLCSLTLGENARFAGESHDARLTIMREPMRSYAGLFRGARRI
jgi:hypothetical protein